MVSVRFVHLAGPRYQHRRDKKANKESVQSDFSIMGFCEAGLYPLFNSPLAITKDRRSTEPLQQCIIAYLAPRGTHIFFKVFLKKTLGMEF